MSLGVLNNISAVYAENNLNNSNNSLSNVLQQLSSGSKINSGADDAAGLSLVDGLQANSRALAQSQTNASEGVGLLKVADGALSQVTNLLNRAVTLATEVSNGTLTGSQQTSANQEYQSILSEISNIGSTTTYNQQAVFNSNNNIYTGDSSTAGSSITALNIRTLSASNLGDTSGTMAYSNGQNNVFIDLSNAGQNASVSDSLGLPTATTTVNVGYLTKGANGVAVNATAAISVGAGTNYANTVQGLLSAINNSGLGVTASFGTAQQAGSGAVASAVAANAVNSALKTGANDTGIIVSGAGIGVNNNSAAAGYTNGVGEVGTLTVANVADQLGGTLNIVGADGRSHAITLGTANSTDTLANLMATINASGYGVTASINSQSVTNASGTHAANTLMTLTSANSAVTVSGTNLTDGELAQPTVTVALTNGGTGTGAGVTLATMSVNASTDTLTGALSVKSDGGNATPYILDGQTLTQIQAAFAANVGGFATNITATLSNNNKTLTFTETAAKTTNYPIVTTIANGNVITDNNATTGVSIVTPTAVSSLPAAGSAGTVGTITLTNASDMLTGGSVSVFGADGTTQTFTLGTAGSTDTLTNLAATINAYGGATGTDSAAKLAATVNSAGTVLTLASLAGGTDQVAMYGSATTTSLSLTGTPTTGGAANATVLGTLSLPLAGSASGDTLGGTLIFGTETIQLGVSTGNQKTDTMADLAQTINSGNYGVNAVLNSAGTAITFTSADSLNAPSGSSIWAPTGTFKDVTDSNTALRTNTFNNEMQSSAYYSLGISGSVSDTSTGGGTGIVGLSNNLNGSSGAATISYSDSAGQSLSATDLSNSADAQAALTAINTAISDVAAQDGYLGAMINTLNAVSQVLSTQSENVTSAQNAVQATDYASATSAMSKYEILSQTGISALAQANSMQQEVTKLLQ